jgi:hypothetical protein
VEFVAENVPTGSTTMGFEPAIDPMPVAATRFKSPAFDVSVPAPVLRVIALSVLSVKALTEVRSFCTSMPPDVLPFCIVMPPEGCVGATAAPEIVMAPLIEAPPIVSKPVVEIALRSALARLRADPPVPRLIACEAVEGASVTAAAPPVTLPPDSDIVSPVRVIEFVELPPPLLTFPFSVSSLVFALSDTVPEAVTAATLRLAALVATDRVPALVTVRAPVSPLPLFASVAAAVPQVRPVVPPIVSAVEPCCVRLPDVIDR